jgi:CheY-like chemotaxis protein
VSVVEELLERPVVLIVEDNEVGLRRRAALLADAGCTPIPVRSRDDALRELRASPGVDMVLTDIHLLDRVGDRSGVELARSAKRINNELPVAGYSAHFRDADELGPDLDLFDRTWIKGTMTGADILRTIDDCRTLALAYRRARTRTALKLLDVLRRRHEAARPDVELLRRLVPGSAESDVVEQRLREAGYRLRLVEADDISGFKAPIIVWLLNHSDSVEAEVYGQPALYADGDDETEAVANLVELMRLYAAELHGDPEAVAGPALDLQQFLARVMGADAT